MRLLARDNFLSHVKHDHETLVDRFNHTGGHGVGGVPVAGTDPAAAVQLAAAAALVAYQLVNHAGRDAGVLQPGREGVPEVRPAQRDGAGSGVKVTGAGW
jgi:hypothetical protein